MGYSDQAKTSEAILEADNSLILGAPGSGKTTMLSFVTQRLEDQGFKPEQILTVVPTRAAATSLRDQLAIDSDQVALSPRARSITSLAFEILRAEQPEIQLISGARQQVLIAELVAQAQADRGASAWGFDSMTSSLAGFHNEIRDLFAVLTENQLSLEALAELQTRWPGAKWQVALDLLPKYLAVLEAANQVDPSQLITRATGALAGYSPPRIVLVDDAQDLSNAGIKFLLQLSENSRLVVFGDPDSASLGFRSAGGFIPETRNALPTLREIYLEPGHSQPEQVQALMARIVERIPTAQSFAHRPREKDSEAIEYAVFDNQIAETDYLASVLRQSRVSDLISWGEMAVVCRTRVQLEQLATALSARSVPVRILGAQAALRDQPAARSVLDFGSLVFATPTSSLSLELLGSRLIGLNVIQQRRLFRQLTMLEDFQNLTRNQMLEALFDSEIDFDSREVKKLNKAISLGLVLRANPEIGAYEFVSKVWSLANQKELVVLAKGATEVALAANRDLDAILELFAAASRFDQKHGLGAREFVALQLQASIPEDSLAQIGLRDRVVLATSAQLSGKSFQVVAMPRLQEGIWPNLRPRNSLLGAASLQGYLLGRSEDPTMPTRSELADELRLFYKSLGVTRSRLILSATSASDEQPSQFLQMARLEPSVKTIDVDFDPRRLVGKLRRELMQGDVSAAAMLAALALSGTAGAHPSNWQGLLPLSTEEPVINEAEQLRLSASRLDAFEKCPLHWFINNFGGDGKSFEASVGTLLHSAMELATGPDALAGFVESNWHTLKFETDWLSLAAKRKAMKMAGYMAEYLSGSNHLVESEQGFEIELGRLVVAGKIDRVERTSEGLIAADLKTGKPPSAKEAAEHRQLALYQLGLREAYQDKVVGGRIISVGSGSLKVLEQPELDGDFQAEILELLARAENEIGQEQFVASISDHCHADANCQMLLARQVTND